MKPRVLPIVLFALLCSTPLQAQEQYRSRMYIDLDVSASENVSLSVNELEKQLGSFQDAATRASAEKFLAQHYAGQKDYGKAAAHIQGALRNPALSADARREMLGQLARIYLLQKQYDGAAKAIEDYIALKPPAAAEAEIYLLLAQVQYQRKNHHGSAAALDKALALQKNPSQELLRTALAIYYTTGSYERAGQVMQRLVAADINNAELWQQWVSLYLKGGKHGPALDVLALAWEKGIPFREQDILLLTDLYAINNIPGRGARVLEEAIASGRIKSSAKLNDRLFRLWMQAGERNKAEAALAKAASAGNDVELQLHLAQLQMEKEQWQPMQQLVLQACEDGPLPEKLVARANLLLGISQLKLGDTALARRSFINATIVGGASDAAQWLAYMKAEPATEREKVGIAGPCYSDDTRSIFTASLPDSGTSGTATPAATQAVEQEHEGATAPDDEVAAVAPAPAAAGEIDLSALASVQGNAAAPLDIKTVGSQRLYLGDYSLSPQQMSEQIVGLATRLGVTIVKNGGKIDGPMHIIFPEPPAPGSDKIRVRFGFPVTGNPPPSGRYQLVRDKGFKCASRTYEGAPEGVALAFAQLHADALARGLTLTGQSRQVASQDNVAGGKTVRLELQVGVQ